MIGPVFGKNDRTVPKGVIQLINKVPENGEKTSEIGPKDIKKFEEMADLIGSCIENTKDISDTI